MDNVAFLEMRTHQNQCFNIVLSHASLVLVKHTVRRATYYSTLVFHLPSFPQLSNLSTPFPSFHTQPFFSKSALLSLRRQSQDYFGVITIVPSEDVANIFLSSDFEREDRSDEIGDR